MQKLSNRIVDIEIISKKNMVMGEVEALRDQVSLFKTCVHPGLIQMVDYFESKDFMYFCLEKNNNISEKEMLTLQSVVNTIEEKSKLFSAFKNISHDQRISLKNYVHLYENKPRNEYI